MSSRYLSLVTVPVLLAALTFGVLGCGSDSSGSSGSSPSAPTVSHVLLISVDGLHQQDLANCIAKNTCPNLAALAQTGRQVVIAGQRAGHNFYTLDGVSITDQYFNNLVISPSIDGLQEFKIEKSKIEGGVSISGWPICPHLHPAKERKLRMRLR